MRVWSTSDDQGARWELTRTGSPAVGVLDREEFKRHARITHVDEDRYLDQLLPAVESMVEAELNLALIHQTFTLVFAHGFPAARLLEFPMAPLVSITSVSYLDAARAAQVLASTKYTVQVGRPGMLQLNESESWPETSDGLGAVTITFLAGFGTAPGAVPQDAIALMWLLASHFYEHREPVITGTIVTPMPMSYKRMLWNLRDTKF